MIAQAFNFDISDQLKADLKTWRSRASGIGALGLIAFLFLLCAIADLVTGYPYQAIIFLLAAVALAFAVTVAAEFMGAEYGIGYLIMQASRTLNTEVVLIGTVVIGIESFALDRSLRLATNYITRWTER